LWQTVDRVEKSQIALDKANLRVSNDLDLVKNAQEKYNAALAKYGETAPETTQAAKDLADAQEKLKIDTDMVALRQGDYNQALYLAATTSIPTAITAITGLQRSYKDLSGYIRQSQTATQEANSALETAAGTAGTAGTGMSGLAGAVGTAAGAIAGAGIYAAGLYQTIDRLYKLFTEGRVATSEFNLQMTAMQNPLGITANAVDLFMKKLGLIPEQYPSLITLTGSFLDQLRGKFVSALDDIKRKWDEAMKGLADAAQSLWNKLTGHSIWTDMLGEMVSQTEHSMAAIKGEFGQGFTGPAGIVPTVQAAQPTVAQGVSGEGAGAVVGTQAITLPIYVYLDGQQIQTILERRLVETIARDAGRSRRG
jgi:hypothetical protein